MQKAENRELHTSADRTNLCFHHFRAQYELNFKGKSGPDYENRRIDIAAHAYNLLKAQWDEAGENARLFTDKYVSHTSALYRQSDLPLQSHIINAYLKALHSRTTTGTFRKPHATRVFARVLQEEAAKASKDDDPALIEAFNAAQEAARVYLNHQSLDKIYYYIHKSIVTEFCLKYGFRIRQLLTETQTNRNWKRASDDETIK